jgi:hypothetical protein
MEARQRQQDTLDARNQEQQEAEQDQEGTNEGENTTTEDPTSTPANATDSDDRFPSNGPATVDTSDTSPNRFGLSSMTSNNYYDNSDQKLPVSPTNRGKQVRVVTPGLAMDSTDSSLDRPAFPAFYRVMQDAGASVYNDGEAVSFVMRVVPFGVVLLGKEISWRNCDGENRLMVRIPDGWVIDEDIERIVAVPFEA